MKIFRLIRKLFLKSLDIILLPFIYVSAVIFKFIRKNDFSFFTFKRTKKILLKVGIYPLIDHYYEPLFHPRHFYKPTRQDRFLPGVDFNDKGQFEFLESLKYTEELDAFPLKKVNDNEYFYNNYSFEDTDAQIYYQILRTYKPKNIIEIGSGFSTKLAIAALRKNVLEDPNYKYNLTCIEPYEMPWLESCKDIKLIRQKVELIDREIFNILEKNDIFFIDSSHIIRPQGDVLAIYLEILPLVKPGVLVHIHDICTPRDYYDIEFDNFHFLNEQYLVEAFLTLNKEFEILSAHNYLSYHHFDVLKKKSPILSYERGLGSIWLSRK
jgi:hypothetical protein